MVDCWLGRSFSFVAVLGVALLGCESSVQLGTGGSGGGASSSSSSSQGPTTTSSGGECATFADQPGKASKVIRIHNDSGVNAFFKSSCGQLDYRINGQMQGNFPASTTCLSTCEDLQTSSPIECDACAPESRRVPPGGTIEFNWDGTGLRDTNMPKSCFHDPGVGPGCEQVIAADPGFIYSFQVSAWSACGGGAPCDCDSEGRCNADVSGASVGWLPSQGEFILGNSGALELTLEPCAFGCPPP
ncbi:MAG: hypothetical protein U0414_42840 [Polyangiaceae bacterium]